MNKMDEVEDEATVMEVHVINRNDFTIQDRFDGTEFKFPQDKAVSVPPDAALHIFGWFPEWTDEEGNKHTPNPDDMKKHVMRRFGWNRPALAGGPGDLYYSNIKIKPVRYRMVPVKELDEEDKAALPAKPTNRITQGARLSQAVDEAMARHQGS